MEKRRKSNFSSFPHYFIHIFLTSGVKLHIHLLNVVVQFIILLTLSALICRGTDISKCFSESLGIRDNKSRLYLSLDILLTRFMNHSNLINPFLSRYPENGNWQTMQIQINSEASDQGLHSFQIV